MALYLLVSGDFDQTGGMDRANYALANHLARRGDELHLVSHRVAADLTARKNVVFHKVWKPANSYFLGELLIDRVGRFWASRISARGGRVVVNGGNCQWGDVNWVHYVHAAYEPQSALGWLSTQKADACHRVFVKRERKAMARARLVIANSKRTQKDLVERTGAAEHKVRVVYYGTDPADFTAPECTRRIAIKSELGWSPQRPIVAFIGALGDRRKGFDTLFDAWQRLCESGCWDADLAVLGSGAELPLWRIKAQKAQIASRIHFMGFRRDVPRVLHGCDALIAPTRYEAYGLGVHEALCCGMPAIVSSDAGVAERFDGDRLGWFLTDPADPQTLVRCLRSWRNRMDSDRVEAAEIGRRLRARTWDAMAAEIVQGIESTSESQPCRRNQASAANGMQIIASQSHA